MVGCADILPEEDTERTTVYHVIKGLEDNTA